MLFISQYSGIFALVVLFQENHAVPHMGCGLRGALQALLGLLGRRTCLVSSEPPFRYFDTSGYWRHSLRKDEPIRSSIDRYQQSGNYSDRSCRSGGLFSGQLRAFCVICWA